MRTIVEREPEWDAAEVAKIQAYLEYESRICACGLHETVADTDPDLDMPMRKCPVCAALARNDRVIQQADEAERRALGKRAEDPMTQLPSDGRHFSLVPRSVTDDLDAR